MRLGPDEWLLSGPLSEAAQIAGDVEAALRGLHHALVDVGHARVALSVSGPRAADAINSGCALDLSPAAFPAGTATRTLLGKAEIVLATMGRGAGFRDRMRPLVRRLRARFPDRGSPAVSRAGLRRFLPSRGQRARCPTILLQVSLETALRGRTWPIVTPAPGFARWTPRSRCSRSTYSAPSASSDAVSAVLTLAVSSSESSFKYRVASGLLRAFGIRHGVSPIGICEKDPSMRPSGERSARAEEKMMIVYGRMQGRRLVRP